jgi:hypothetical protein
MAGYTPPKDPSRRARRNKDPRATVVLDFTPGAQPPLPSTIDWHPQTHVWWDMWGNSPMAELFVEADWIALAEAAIYHTALWNGNLSAGPELRLRVQKFGMTPEDRARLRIVFADAQEKESKMPATSSKPAASRGGKSAAGGLSLVGED